MARIQERHLKRLSIIQGNAPGMECGAFVDFFLNEQVKGNLLRAAGTEFDKYLRENEDNQDVIVQATSTGLNCNMIFGVCVNHEWYQQKFDETEFKKTVLDVLIECFKNCVDSIVINCVGLKEMLKGSKVKNYHSDIIGALRSFYTGEKIGESGHQHSKRFTGNITIVCEDQKDVGSFEKERKNIGQIIKEVEPDYVIRKGKFSANLNSMKRSTSEFYRENTLVNKTGPLRTIDYATVQARLLSLESTLNLMEALIKEYDSLNA